MTSMISQRKIATATATGLALGFFSCYLLAECSHGHKEKKTETRPVKTSETLTIQYGKPHKLGNYRFHYIKTEKGVQARIKFKVKNGLVDTGLNLKQGQPVSLAVSEKKQTISVMLNSHDEKSVNVTVTIN